MIITTKSLLPSLLVIGIALSAPRAAQATDSEQFQRSYAYEVQGKYREALGALDRMSSGAKATYLYTLRRGWLLYLLRDYRPSIEAYRKAVSLAPKAVEPLLGLSLPQLALRLWLDASRSCKQALAIDSDNFAAMSRLAHASYQLGRHREAASLYRRLVALYPADLTMKSGLGWALLRSGDKAGAKRQFAIILRFAPGHVAAKEGMSWAGR